MPELGLDTLGCPKAGKSAPNPLDPELLSAQEPPAQVASLPAQGASCGLDSEREESSAKALLFRANRAMNVRRPEAVLAGLPPIALATGGLPAEVMDGLVEDLAEAVLAVLLSQETAEADEHDDASGDLREV